MIKPGRIYKLFKPNVYTSKKGNPYLRASICDSERQSDGTYKENGWYNVLIFTNADEIYSAGKVQISAINGVEKKITDYNGKRYENMNLLINGHVPGDDPRGGGNPNPNANYGDALYDHQQPKQSKPIDDFEPLPESMDIPF